MINVRRTLIYIILAHILSYEDKVKLYGKLDHPYLYYNTNDEMEEFWNLPSNNLNFLQFLKIIGRELPSSSSTIDRCVDRLSEVTDEMIHHYLVKEDLYVILQLLNRRMINLNPYHGNKIVDPLIPHQIINMKSARTII